MCSINFVKGMSVGLIVGMAVGIAVTPKKKKNTFTGKLLKTFGSLIDGVSDAMGL